MDRHVAREVAVGREGELEGAPRRADAGHPVAGRLDARVFRRDGHVGAVGGVDVEGVGPLDVDKGRLGVRLARRAARRADLLEPRPEVVGGGDEFVETLVLEDELEDRTLRHPGGLYKWQVFPQSRQKH